MLLSDLRSSGGYGPDLFILIASVEIWIFKFDIDFGPRDRISSLSEKHLGGVKRYVLQIPP